MRKISFIEIFFFKKDKNKGFLKRKYRKNEAVILIDNVIVIVFAASRIGFNKSKENPVMSVINNKFNDKYLFLKKINRRIVLIS